MREIAHGIPIKIVVGSIMIGLAAVFVSYLKKEFEFFEGWNGIDYMTPFCMFYLTFSNASAFGKWWKLRDILGTVVSLHVDAACLLSSHLPENTDMSKASKLLKLSLYSSLSFARGLTSTEAYISWLGKAGSLDKKEIETYSSIRSDYNEFGYAEATNAFFKEASNLMSKQAGKLSSEQKIVIGTSLENARAGLRAKADDFYVHFTQRFPVAYHNMVAMFMYPTIVNIPFAVSSPDDYLKAFVLGTFGGCFFYGTYVFRFVLFAPVVADKEIKTLDQFDVVDFATRGHRSIDRILRTATEGVIKSDSETATKGGSKKQN
eukprot:TRINITY_DN31835_c0_g1_i1.p1 TRINITY_DN31835_c0_g1~~TRINITY_DN31835_c0_g1_i1.p1  ORF type:complete len:340 (+),score=59.98 TRINITY_DN31835_c0_g1_i1:65-1021(+)